MKQYKKTIALALALVLRLSLAAFASKTETAASTEAASTETASETAASKGTITVAASPTPHAEILAQAKPILEAEGWTLEVKEFQDYVQPNNVVESGEFDANYFQQIPYLENFNEEQGTPAASTMSRSASTRARSPLWTTSPRATPSLSRTTPRTKHARCFCSRITAFSSSRTARASRLPFWTSKRTPTTSRSSSSRPRRSRV